MRTYTPKEWIKSNLITNKKINAILEKIANIPVITVDNELSETSTNPVQNKVIKTALDNIVPPSITVDDALSTSSENPVQNKVVTNAIDAIQKIYRADSYVTYDTLIQMGEDFNNNVTVVLYYDDIKLTLYNIFTSGGTTSYSFVTFEATTGNPLPSTCEDSYVFSKPTNSTGNTHAQLKLFTTRKYIDYSVEITSIDSSTTVPTFKISGSSIALTSSLANASYFKNLNKFIKYDGYYYNLIDLDITGGAVDTYWYKAEKYENNNGTLTKHERLLILKFASNGTITTEHYII